MVESILVFNLDRGFESECTKIFCRFNGILVAFL